MTDIVARLRRSTDPFWHHERPELVSEAADEIERLRLELIKTRAVADSHREAWRLETFAHLRSRT